MKGSRERFDKLRAITAAALREAGELLLGENGHRGGPRWRKRVAGDIDALTQDYLQDFDSVHPQKPVTPARLGDGGPDVIIESNLRGSGFRIYVSLPICNGSEFEVHQSLVSVINNLSFVNFCLLIVVNSGNPDLEFLKARGVSHVVFRPKKLLSLPESYNMTVRYANDELGAQHQLLCFMDDDARVMGNQQAAIRRNIRLVESGELLAASGHCYDNRDLAATFFQSVQRSNTYAFVTAVPKPYCHGGALMIMKASSFPKGGMPLTGLGGLNLTIPLINKFTPRELAEMASRGKWFLANNPGLRIFHPLKGNILSWSATYLAYKAGWGVGMSGLKGIYREVWLAKLQRVSQRRTEALWKDYRSSRGGRYALGNLLVTRYYRPLLNKHFRYDDFKELVTKRHVNL